MFHGGGCTPFTQVNDTHLHAQLAKFLVQIENHWALEERERFALTGENRTPTMTRETILALVQAAWTMIPHDHVAEKGYKQTGPAMPLKGPVKHKEVFGDLLTVMESIQESTPQEVGMKLRDDAVAFVQDGYDKFLWRTWADCQKLITEQDGVDEAEAEGMEAFGTLVDDAESEVEAVEDAESEDDDDPGEPSGGLSAKKPDATGDVGDELEHDVLEGDDVQGGAPATDCFVVESEHSEGCAADESKLKLMAARRLLYDEAVKGKDDRMLKIMRREMQEDSRHKAAASSDAGIELRKRALERQALDAKRRTEFLAAEKLAAKDLVSQGVARAKAEQATEQARVDQMKLLIINRRDMVTIKHADATEKAQQRWLQTEYPAKVAKRCWNVFKDKAPDSKQRFESNMELLLKPPSDFNRHLSIPYLWAPDKTLTTEFGTICAFQSDKVVQVRCSLPFQELLQDIVPWGNRHRMCVMVKGNRIPVQLVGPDAVDTLFKLFEGCVPFARRVFHAHYTPIRLLHINEYVLDKAFVYGIVALSKWMTKYPTMFPQGIYEWPPACPKDLIPVPIGLCWSSVVPVDGEVALLPSDLHTEVASASSSTPAHKT